MRAYVESRQVVSMMLEPRMGLDSFTPMWTPPRLAARNPLLFPFSAARPGLAVELTNRGDNRIETVSYGTDCQISPARMHHVGGRVLMTGDRGEVKRTTKSHPGDAGVYSFS